MRQNIGFHFRHFAIFDMLPLRYAFSLMSVHAQNTRRLMPANERGSAPDARDTLPRVRSSAKRRSDARQAKE